MRKHITVKFQNGMATLMATTSLLLLTSMSGWLSFKSVSAETTRSQQQMFAAQALATSEALLETAIASIDLHYASRGAAADLLLWNRASPLDCPANKPATQWQCMLLSMPDLPLPVFADPVHTSVRLVRDAHQSPHRIIVMTETRLNAMHPGVGSRATVQQALYVPIHTAPHFLTPVCGLSALIPLAFSALQGRGKMAANHHEVPALPTKFLIWLHRFGGGHCQWLVGIGLGGCSSFKRGEFDRDASQSTFRLGQWLGSGLGGMLGGSNRHLH